MIETDFVPLPYQQEVNEAKITWKSPSNIALVKYWGKKAHQIPANPSISFTLSACATTTSVTFEKLQTPSKGSRFDFFFEGRPKEDFKPKIDQFFERTKTYLPFLGSYHLKISSSNSFPHSSGIASSASGMSALALCLVDFERFLNPEMTEAHFIKKASFLARLGSGSACRSIEGALVQWGAHAGIAESSDLYGIRYEGEVAAIFNNYHDTILLVDKGQKQVSSTVGHGLMHGHPFSEQRFAQAHDTVSSLQSILASGDLKAFIQLVESEALTLHAMMMTSLPYFVLMKPNTLQIINKIWAFRERSDTHLCFTLDAGANVHVLYPENEKTLVYPFIQEELLPFCEKRQHICDRVGFGAKKVTATPYN